MMNDHRLQADSLQEALGCVEDQIRSDPSEPRHRVYLFQLLTVLGSWDRALNQLKVLEELDPSAIPMVGTYRAAIQCELLRADIFAGQRSPVIFGEPAEWTALLIESIRLTAGDNHAQAEDLRAQAFEAAPTTSGSINGEPFTWIADSDSRLGPVLEVIINGRYAWVPFDRIGRVVVEEPSDLRDAVWMPSLFTWANGGEMVGLVPTRYSGTETCDDGQLLLSRKTDWIEVGAETYLGQGQRMLATDTGDYALMDVRELLLDSEAGDSAPGPDVDSNHG